MSEPAKEDFENKLDTKVAIVDEYRQGNPFKLNIMSDKAFD